MSKLIPSAVIMTVAAAAVATAFGLSAGSATAQSEPNPALVDAMQRDLGLTKDQALARMTAERQAEFVQANLGLSAGQAWFDSSTGKLVVAVTDQQQADKARAAGADPKLVAYGPSKLNQVATSISALQAPAAVNSWGADPQSDSVVITVNAKRKDAATEAFLVKAKALGAMVRVVETDKSPVQHGGEVRGGDKWIPGSESQCTIGFAVTSNNGANKHFLSAGHCTNDANQAAYGKDGTRVGTSNVGGNHTINALEGDFGLIDVDQAGWTLGPVVTTNGVATDVRLTGSKDATVGTAVCHSGAASKWKCGSVTKVNQTVNYGSFSVGGLTYASTCGIAGDSGGSWVTVSDSKAVGLHEGGYGDSCGQQEAWYQPVNEALAKWNLTLVIDGGDTTAPSAPGNLRSTGKSATSVALAWDASTDNVGVTAYDVYNGSTLATTVTGTSANVTGLTASTAYNFTVKARDAAGNASAASNSLSVTTDAGGGDTSPPTAPGNLRSTGTTASSVALAWDASTDNVGVTAYDVYNGSTLATTVTGTSANVTGLAASTSYTFTVKARDAAGNASAASNSVNATTQSGGGGTRTFSTNRVAFIPDPGVANSPITSTAAGSAASSVSLTVTASHWCGQELKIELVAPNGTVYLVKAAGGSGCTNYSGGSYTVGGVSSAASGTWTLRVTDTKSWNFGSLNGWSVTL